ncbi:MAG TPA: hypothetical protein VGU22_06935 [Methylomirabilota bacterium]|nr:hypothetical protein [Methylomirabilota bacterium]
MRLLSDRVVLGEIVTTIEANGTLHGTPPRPPAPARPPSAISPETRAERLFDLRRRGGAWIELG